MIIKDRVYGKITVNESVLIDLINSVPLQRLKRIKQAGISGYIVPFKKTITRFEHSVGVMFLLRKFGGVLKEQIAGLLHDVSHTAFSHVVDFVFPNKEHTFHEWHYRDMIVKTEIATILKRHNYKPEDFLNQKQFTLLEKEIPDLCADRIDYFLRDRNARLGKKGDQDHLLKYLKNYNNEFFFTNEKIALKFANDYLYQNKVSWYSPEEGYCYIFFAKILKNALNKNLLTKRDLFADDETVWKKLRGSNDKQIKKELSLLFKPMKFKLKKVKDSILIKSKPRYIDPKILKGKKLQRLSALNNDFKNGLQKEIEWMKKGFWVKATFSSSRI